MKLQIGIGQDRNLTDMMKNTKTRANFSDLSTKIESIQAEKTTIDVLTHAPFEAFVSKLSY